MVKHSLLPHKLELLGSSPDPEIKYNTVTGFFKIFLGYSRPSTSIKLSHNSFLSHLCTHLLTDHPTIQSHMILSTERTVK